MTKNADQLFQERIDELLLLEQRSDRRAQKFIQLTRESQEKNQDVLNDLLEKMLGINESLRKIDAASDSVNQYVRLSARHATRTTKLFIGTVIGAVLIISGTLWWSHHINSDLTGAKAALARLNGTLQHTPVIVRFQGKDFVRVVPETETSFTRRDNTEMPGRYSKVWHIR